MQLMCKKSHSPADEFCLSRESVIKLPHFSSPVAFHPKEPLKMQVHKTFDIPHRPPTFMLVIDIGYG
jgi:hypothetical protein